MKIISRLVRHPALRAVWTRWSHSLAAGSTLAIAGQFVGLVISFVTVPLTVGYLGKERYGLWMTAASLLTFLTIIEAGYIPALKNRLASAFAVGDEREFSSYATASFMISALVAVGILALMPIAIIVPWNHIFNVRDPVAAAELVPLMMVLIAVSACTFATSFISAVYAARAEISTTLVANLVTSILGCGLLLLVIYFRGSLRLLVVTVGGPSIVARLVLIYRLHLRYPRMFSFAKLDAFRVLMPLVPSSIAFIGLQLTNVLLSTAPNLITARYLGVSEVAVLSVVQKLASVPLLIVGAIMPVFWPAFTIAWRRCEHVWITRRFTQLIVVVGVGLTIYSLLLVAVGPAVIGWWLSGKIRVGHTLFIAFGAWVTLQGLWYSLSTLLNSRNDVRFQVICNCVQFGILAGCVISLSHRLNLVGLVSIMAIATGIGAVAPSGLRAARHMALSPSTVAQRIIARVLRSA